MFVRPTWATRGLRVARPQDPIYSARTVQELP